MSVNVELAGKALIDAMECYRDELKEVSDELDFAIRKAQQHKQRIINGDNSFFERMFFWGAYERCTELIERAHAIDNSIRQLKKSRAFVLIHTEWDD